MKKYYIFSLYAIHTQDLNVTFKNKIYRILGMWDGVNVYDSVVSLFIIILFLSENKIIRLKIVHRVENKL